MAEFKAKPAANPARTPDKRQIKRKKPAAKAGARRNSDAFTRALAVVIVFLAFYLIISLFVAGAIYYSFNDTAKAGEIYSVRVVYDEKTLYNLSAQTVNNEYGLYVPFSRLTDICAFGLAGDGDEMTIFLIGTDDRIECTKNSSLIIINDNPIRISAPVLYSEDDYLIPVVLLQNYINGIDVSFDDEKMICTLSSALGKTNASLKIQLPDDLAPAYFPESYKVYKTTSDESTQP